MVAHTGMPAHENAAMLLHILMTDPDNAATKLKVILSNGKAAPPPDHQLG